MQEETEREWSTLEKKDRKGKCWKRRRCKREIEIVFFRVQQSGEVSSLLSILQPQCTVRFTVTAENYSVKC